MTDISEVAPSRPVADLLEEFRAHLAEERVLAPATIRTYMSAINVFIRVMRKGLGREVLARDFGDRNAMRVYIRGHLSKLSASRSANHRAAVGGMHNWLMDEGYIPWGPNYIKDAPVARTATTAPRDRRLSSDEIRAVLKAADNFHPLYRHLFLFMLESNLRISEVVGTVDYEPLRWSAVRWDEDVIIFNNYKGKKHGLSLPLTPELRAILTAWKDVYEKDLAKTTPGLERVPVKGAWFIFPALRGLGKAPKGRKRRMILNPMARLTEPRAITKRLFMPTGIYQGRGDSWHMVGRKTGGNAVRQVARNVGRADSLELAQAALHHKDSRTTHVYLDPNEDYRRYHIFRMQHSIWDAALLAEIPELRPAWEARQAQADASPPETAAAQPEPAQPDPDDTPQMATVIPFTSRRRA